MNPTFTFTFDGQTIQFQDGWTVAAALTAAGIRSWRTTRKEARPRGIFCGIGVCYDCLITVNDQPSLRACLLPAHAGDVIVTQHGTGHDER